MRNNAGMTILPSRKNTYTGSPLDRLGDKRDEPGWAQSRMDAEDTLFTPVWRARSLIRGSVEPRAALLRQDEAAAVRAAAGHWALLGTLPEAGGRAVFALEVGGTEDPAPLLPEGARFEDLRALAGLLQADEAAILAHARALMHWRVRNRFCANCGTACEVHSAGHVMQCPGCGAHHFPRTDSAVIMLVHRGDRALLGHSTRFPNSTMYSTLAGFVEPGESLEEAVAREVLEESAIQVGEVRYHSSQPWPFPANIMLGFYAEALTEEITIDATELVDARWFSKAELREPETHGFSLPRLDSIARRLIEDWMAQP